jgi:thioredoxin-dependent peroxiredoxin
MSNLEGQKAPVFNLEGSDGKKHSLADYAGTNVVLYFYPKDDTPGCTKEACGFRDSMEAVTKANAVVLGVSKEISIRIISSFPSSICPSHFYPTRRSRS